MGFYPIDAMKGLKAHLGKARTDRIRYAQRGTYKRQPGATNIENTVIDAMQRQQPSDCISPVSDILTGIARAGSTTVKPLSVHRLYAILQCMPIINTRQIQIMMAIEPRQARRYLAALKVAMPFLVRALIKKRTERLPYGTQQKPP